MNADQSWRATTVLAVQKDGQTVMGSDGQVTLGNTVIKHGAVKVRKLSGGDVLAGFAGQTADALSLFDRFEGKLQEYSGDLRRAAVELAKDWRTEKILQRLEAMLMVADKDSILMISGNGDVLQPDRPILAVGSGGPYAYAAAEALAEHSSLSAEEIVREALAIASRLCIYTNDSISLETVGTDDQS